jgi:hypothetical protein
LTGNHGFHRIEPRPEVDELVQHALRCCTTTQREQRAATASDDDQ